MAKSVAEPKPSTRERVLDAARHLLAHGGYDSLSMRRLARRVGCKAPGLYYHFENKDDIVHTLIGEGYDRQHAFLEEAAAAHTHPLRRVEARARAYVAFALAHPEYYRIMYMLRTDEMARFPKARYRRSRRSLERTVADLKEAAARGLTQLDGDPYARATADMAMLHGGVALVLSGRLDAGLDPDDIIERILQRTLPVPAADAS